MGPLVQGTNLNYLLPRAIHDMAGLDCCSYMHMPLERALRVKVLHVCCLLCSRLQVLWYIVIHDHEWAATYAT